MPSSACYVLEVDDHPLWVTTSKRQAYLFANPYIADNRRVRIRLTREHADLAEWRYDPSSASWQEESSILPRHTGR